MPGRYMKIKQQKLITIIFWIVVGADIFGIATGITSLHYFAKPLLIPLLILLLIFSKTVAPHKILLVTGLIFSWLGDMFLLFENSNALFFIFGLVCFLITHIFYIIYFNKIKSDKPSLLFKQPLSAIFVIGYGIFLVWLLFPYLAELKIPVMVYALVICTMLLCSIHIFYKVNTPANRYYLTGAFLFVLSDSILALNKFYFSFTLAGVFIMLTYCAAQYFIVRGFIKYLPHD